MKIRAALFASVAVLGLAGGLLFAWQQQVAGEPVVASARGDAPGPGDSLLGEPRPDYLIGATDGRVVAAADFDGEVVLVNFWATWCAPCREEMPMLVEVQEEYADLGLSIVGIALDDVAQARDFAAELGVTYTVLVGGADVMAAGAAYGNRSGVLPYTVLVDREGIVRWVHLGVLVREQLVQEIKKLL